MTWHAIDDPEHPAPRNGQFLVTQWELGATTYSEIELVQAPFLKDGRILNLNSGNYTMAGVWTHWHPAPSLDGLLPPPEDGK